MPTMGLLSDEQVEKVIQDAHVRIAILIELHFVSKTCFVWTGLGDLITLDETRWSGLGEVVNVQGLSSAVGTVANSSTVTLSGNIITPETVKVASDNRDEADGQPIKIHGQLFSQAGEIIGNYFNVVSGVMSNMQFKGSGPDKRTISVNVEGLFTRRRRPVFGWLTDFDQQQRFPGDLGLSYVNEVIDKSVTWPDF